MSSRLLFFYVLVFLVIGMDLRDFVKESLVQIIQGVSDAQLLLKDQAMDGCVSPLSRNDWAALENRGTLLTRSGVPIRDVEFDVSVTATAGEGKKGGVRVAVSVLGLGGEAQSSSSSSNISRLKFSVPVSLPVFLDKNP
ncbi:MAG: hypothetical protein LWW92_04510 [Rhodocyclales bacterium]|nr:hypothetical protein [Rhodocyclales bacterium]